MILDKMFAQGSVIGLALQASSLKNDVINNNIANADVPGYKKKTVEFDSLLSEALDKARRTGNLDLTNVKPQIEYVDKNFSYRIDENNVDVETEMVALYQNSIKYDTMVNSIISNSKRINLAITGR